MPAKSSLIYKSPRTLHCPPPPFHRPEILLPYRAVMVQRRLIVPAPLVPLNVEWMNIHDKDWSEDNP